MAGAEGWNEVTWPEADDVDLAGSTAIPTAGSYMIRFVRMSNGKARKWFDSLKAVIGNWDSLKRIDSSTV